MTLGLQYEAQSVGAEVGPRRSITRVLLVDACAIVFTIVWITVAIAILDGTPFGQRCVQIFNSLGVTLEQRFLFASMNWAIALTPAPGTFAITYFAIFRKTLKLSHSLGLLILTALSWLPVLIYVAIVAVQHLPATN